MTQLSCRASDSGRTNLVINGRFNCDLGHLRTLVISEYHPIDARLGEVNGHPLASVSKTPWLGLVADSDWIGQLVV
jgi:hypothetical protein